MTEFDNVLRPDLSGARFGLLGEYLRYHRSRRELEERAKAGWIEWRFIDEEGLDRKLVQPEHVEEDTYAIDHAGEKYYFEYTDLLANHTLGVWTCAHRAGEPEPIDLHRHRDPVIPAAALYNFNQMELDVSAPSSGLLDRLDAQTVYKWGMGAIVLLLLYYAITSGFGLA